MAGQARVALLVRTDLVATSPHALDLRRTMRQVPGFEAYFGASGFDPLTDFEWMTLRTPNPTSLILSTVTAGLAVEPARARAVVAELRDPGTQPRQVRATPGDPRPRVPNGPLAWSVIEPGPLLLAGPRPWVRRASRRPDETRAAALAGLADVGLGEGPPALVIAAEDLSGLIDRAGVGWPMPTGFVMAARFDDSAVLGARLFFRSEREADRFVARVRSDLDAWSVHPLALLMDLPGLASDLRLERAGSAVRATVVLEPGEVVRALALMRLLLAPSGPESDPAAEPGAVVDGPRTGL
jgi:hypothetical protein